MARLEDVLGWPSLRQACQATGACQNTGYNWVWTRKVDAVQVCGVWRVNPKDVKRMAKKRAEAAARKEARNGNS